MNIPAEFNEIRPYTPEELPQIYEELIADPAFRTVVESVMPGVPFEGLAMKMRQCKTNLEFQKAFFYGLLWDLVKKTANGLTFDCSALSDLTRNYTFISNHRDIILDSAFLSILLIDNGMTTVEIAIGDNLLIYPWIHKLVRVNKSFIVKRGLNMRQKLEASALMSRYMHFAMKEKHENLWIAQRQGRAKDSNDRTQDSVLKMMAMAGEGDVTERLKELNIVPLAISYEYDPCDFLKAKETSADNILVTSGSQQGLDYSARVFCDKGDVVIIESPSYLGALNAFKACEPNFVAIPTDGDGMIMEELEKVLATTENVKMIYVIPDFQNPSGRTWPLERRKQFMDIINKYEIPVVEDNPYGELRFEGEYLPALKSMDTKGLVVFLGTFSKILAPGYRLGWVCADGEILQKYNFLAQAASLQASTEAQLVVSKFIDMFDLDEHVATIRACYKKRRDVMIATMEREFPPEAKFTHPNGGLFTWVELPEYINTNVMAKQCLARNVAYVPGDGFFPDAGHNNCIRLNYSCMPEEKIEKGMTILGEVIKANLKK